MGQHDEHLGKRRTAGSRSLALGGQRRVGGHCIGGHFRRLPTNASAEVRRRHPDARLDVAGGHPPIDAPGVHGHRQLRLDRPEDRRRLADLFALATCFVMPSTIEPFGIVYAEAAGFGIASIAGSAGGTATAVGAGGLRVDPADQGALVDAMVTMSDPLTAERLGALAARRAPEFTWRKVAERILRAAGIAPPDVGELAPFLDDRPTGPCASPTPVVAAANCQSARSCSAGHGLTRA